MKNKKFVLSILLSSVYMVCGAAPTKSMLATDLTRIDEGDDPVLPDGIVAVEYIESTGTQYINTGIPYNSYTDEINCTIEVTEVVKYGYVFGCNENINGGTRYFAVRRLQNYDRWQFLGASNISSLEELYLNTTYHIRISPQYKGSFINDYYFNSSYSDNYVYTRPLYLLAVNNIVDAAFKNKAKLYHYSHLREGETIIDLIPVRVEDDYSNDFGAMYDLVSGELFLNQGTGSFIIGPDL